MIEIFDIDVKKRNNADMLESWLILTFPGIDFNFDISDQESILRSSSMICDIDGEGILRFVKSLGYSIERLD